MAQARYSQTFYVWRSGTLVHAQCADDGSEFCTSTDEADALEQAGYDYGDYIVYGQPDDQVRA